MEFIVEHIFLCSRDRFWQIYFSQDFHKKLHVEILGDWGYELLKQEENNDQLIRQTQIVAGRDMPTFIRRLIFGEITYIEEHILNKKKHIMKFRLLPKKLQAMFDISGTHSLELISTEKIRRIVRGQVNVKIFGIGSAIEKYIDISLRKDLEKEKEFLDKFILQTKGKK